MPLHQLAGRGQGLIEYAFILVLVSVFMIIILMVFLGPQIGNVYSMIVDTL